MGKEEERRARQRCLLTGEPPTDGETRTQPIRANRHTPTLGLTDNARARACVYRG